MPVCRMTNSSPPIRDLLQQGIPHGVTQRVVDRLEPIQIDQQNGTRFPGALQAPNRFLEALAQEQPVRQTGERIVPGHLVGLDLGSTARRHIFERDRPSLIGDRVQADVQEMLLKHDFECGTCVLCKGTTQLRLHLLPVISRAVANNAKHVSYRIAFRNRCVLTTEKA